MKDTEERLKKQSGEANNDVEKIIEKVVQSAMKPTYAQALGAEPDTRTASRDLQIKNDAKILLELKNEGRGTPKTPKGEHKHLMTTAKVWSTTVSCI